MAGGRFIKVAPKKQTAMVVAKKALRKVNKINKGIENKYFIAGYGTAVTANSTGWDQFCMNQIADGTLDGERDGDMITAKSIEIDLMFQMSGNVDGGQAVRVVILQDKQADPGTAVPIADVFQTTSSDFISQLARNAGADVRFRILHDKIYNCDPVNGWYDTGGTVNNMLNTQKFASFTLTKFSKNLYYVGAASNQFGKNSIYCFLTRLNDSSNGSVVTPSIRWTIKYTDS